MQEAGCVVLGGHSVNDDEVKFGYAVTGTVAPNRILTNAGAVPGDALLLTKRIGTGVIATALKRGIAREEHVAASVESMLTLNKHACEVMLRFDVRACTDVTGFGLLGHAREMALASNVTLEIERPPSRCCPARKNMRGPAPFPAASTTTASSSRPAWKAISRTRTSCSTRRRRVVCSSP